MIGNSENGVNPPVVNEFSLVITAIKIVILAIFLVPLARYTIVSKDASHNVSDLIQQEATVLEDQNDTLQTETDTQNATVKDKTRKIVVKQPSCPKSYMLVILSDICTDLFVKYELCTPEDFHDPNKHKIPRKYIAKNNSNKEPKVPTIINYAIGILLVVSLGAALVEFYKAKRHPSRKGDKNPLSRKCSLADLTVMKHHRKELVRRESILEVPEDGHSQLGFKPPPLHRQCSFPTPIPHSIDPSRHISYIDGKPAAVIDSRRQSLIIDGRQSAIITDSRRTSIDFRGMPIDGRRISVSEQDSPERRHHGRLVHRH